MRIVFVGAGAIAKAHLTAFRYLGAEVVAVCSRGPSAELFAKENKIPKYYHSAVEMVEQVKPEAVCVLTYPSSYAEVMSGLHRFRLPTLIEKPIGYCSKEAEALKPYLHGDVFVGLNRRFYGGVRAVRERLQNSQGMFVQLFLPERAKDFINLDENSRNRWHVLNGIHGVDLLTYLAGSPQRMMARESWGELNFTQLPQFQTALYETNRGHRVIFMTHHFSSGGWRLHFFLPEEEIMFSPFEETKVKRMTGLEILPQTEDDQNGKPGFIAQTRCFLDGIKGKKDADWVTFDSALNSMRVIEQLFGESPGGMCSGQNVNIPGGYHKKN